MHPQGSRTSRVPVRRPVRTTARAATPWRSMCLPMIVVGLFGALPVVGPVYAGPNAGGTLIIHDTGLLGSVGPEGPVFTPLAECAVADTEAAVGVECTWVVYAAFPAEGSPRFKGLTFQERFDPGSLIITGGGMMDPPAAHVVVLGGWPTTDEGVIWVTFDPAQTTKLVPICWFSGEAAVSGTTFRVSDNPGASPVFRDDSSPPEEDPVLGFGTLGFGVAGSNRCPGGLGFCCRCDGACSISTEAECAALLGGDWWTADYSCEPNMCLVVSTDDGACCLPDATCRIETPCGCRLARGVYKGDFTPCSPTPCITPVREVTWGWIKNRYRGETTGP